MDLRPRVERGSSRESVGWGSLAHGCARRAASKFSVGLGLLYHPENGVPSMFDVDSPRKAASRAPVRSEAFDACDGPLSSRIHGNAAYGLLRGRSEPIRGSALEDTRR